MAKAKHQKPKPSKEPKQPHIKRRGKQADTSDFRAQLDVLGLKIIEVTADGNCFFRALADQLEGNEDEHEKYRNMVVRFIKNNREMFEPFVEDEVPFDEYCRSMGEDGTWAGNMELQAASLVTRSNICIHRFYHDGEHYNSVRSKEDTCCGPARPIVIKGDTDVSASNQPKGAVVKSKQEGGGYAIQEESIKMVKLGSGCEDAKKIEQVVIPKQLISFKRSGCDVDAAIEALVAEQGCVDQIVADDEFSDSVKVPYDEHQDENSEQLKLKDEDETCKDSNKTDNKSSSQPDEKKIPRNKACPCGSKKKYKSCCGSVLGNLLQEFQLTKQLTTGKVGKRESKVEKLDQLLLVPSNPMEGLLTWVHFASNRIFQATAETDTDTSEFAPIENCS
ncbi:UNVERIFIED_CONTAM: OVARIAN TUMOR DOMAIN-containing deubiquitinating enzyme 7 [Sesamum calycinum]|uniref:OVARIAN TUMOR DOMAIN-containing deubiquitinating enzyme 7 n=1 Tax=Sesamum calycinum TaxID=2727403 RepID=A0AAW2SW94_9LAMI